MKNLNRFFLNLALAAAMALPAFAYEDTTTHHQMTLIATRKTVLYTDPTVVRSLGIWPVNVQAFGFHGRIADVPAGTTFYNLAGYVAEGAVAEDAGLRALHHFYDPVYDRGITGLSYRSWAWTLTENINSLRAARNALTRGLTHNEGLPGASEAQRFFAISLMLKNLGHAMHHMQDMAQPQHVRHDQHLSYFNINPSLYEHHTARLNLAAHMQSGNPVYPGSADFRTARDFWFNPAGSGIAQMTNRDFLSQGTNFLLSSSGVSTGEFAHPQPGGHTDITAAQLFAENGMSMTTNLQAQCANPVINCTVTLYATPLSTRATTLSVFDQDLRARGIDVDFDWSTLGGKAVTRRFFDLNRFNYNDVYRILMPRAIGYSAGIVNHFLRGKLEISKPQTGPYAVADQAAGEGFKKVRATVKNVTPNEALQEGSIRAIMKFRRNGCYKPDLTGEYALVGGQAQAPCTTPRGTEAQIRVSEEQPATLAAGESKPFTFTFSDPVPLDATDVLLQVYYTGQVGAETESFALGSVDISEPTFNAFMNATDLFELNGVFYYGDEIIANIASEPYSAADLNDDRAWSFPPDPPLDGISMSFEISIAGAKVATVSNVPEGRFVRLAVLTDNAPYAVTTVARGSWFTKTDNYTFGPKIVHDTGVTNLIQTTGSLRGLRQFNIATLHNYYPQGVANIDTMQESLVTDADKPVPVTIEPSFLGMSSSNEWASSMSVFRAMQTNALSTMLPTPESSPQFPLPTIAPSPQVVIPSEGARVSNGIAPPVR
ncbi:MAG TPA: hypothetical protein VEO54_24765 [Thermoanaerobaculia bacterium]|nr:hypothetical protein [Thermoanaerobaculia bacterium]